MEENFEDQLKKVKFFEERNLNARYQWGIYSFVINGEEDEIQVIVDYQKRIVIKNLMFITDLLNQQGKHIKQLKVLLKDAEEEIKTLKESNQNLMESLVNKESENDDNQETEVRECSFCGEFRTEYHEYEDYSWSAEDFCNAGHDLEGTDPNSCKDYWDKF